LAIFADNGSGKLSKKFDFLESLRYHFFWGKSKKDGIYYESYYSITDYFFLIAFTRNLFM